MDNLKEYYLKNIDRYVIAAKKIEDLIEDLIKNENIQILNVNSRVKSVNSYLEKAEIYKNPKTDIMDYIGIRIITYVLNDMEKISDIIRKEFSIDETNSKDKSEELGNNIMGYRSIHFIATINNTRSTLAEYTICKDCVFEIQIRTIFQHSWAEIEHDKNYKYSGVLPKAIKRRLNILSAVLESVDNEFNTISLEIDNYINNVYVEINNNNLSNIELNSVSLKEYLLSKYPEYDLYKKPVDKESEIEIIHELKSFGIISLKGIEDIMIHDYIVEILNPYYNTNVVGLFRILMILGDSKKYFENCFRNTWGGLSLKSRKIYEKFNPKILDIIRSKGITIMN